MVFWAVMIRTGTAKNIALSSEVVRIGYDCGSWAGAGAIGLVHKGSGGVGSRA